MTEQGPEPTGWELMRSLKELREDIKAVGSRVVSTEVYNADKQGNADRHQRSEARIRDLENAAGDAEKWRRQARLSIALASVSGIIGVAAIIAGVLQ